jgi:hypothetical protein
MATMLAEDFLKPQVCGNYACSTPAESAGDGDELYGYVCRLPICKSESHFIPDRAGNDY